LCGCKALCFQLDPKSPERAIAFSFLLGHFPTRGVPISNEDFHFKPRLPFQTKTSIDWKRPALGKRSKEKEEMFARSGFLGST
jgi:hypothetical protein